MKRQLGFLTLTAIQAGIYICVSAIMAGHILYTSIGFASAVIGIILGSFFLWLLNLAFVKLTLLHRKVLIEIVREYFGERGAKICGLAMGISLMGWFSIQIELMADGVYSFYSGLPKNLWIATFGSLVTINVIKGMDWIGKLADFTVPLLLLMMAYVAWYIYDPTVPIPESIWQMKGVILILAFSLAGVIDTPTYFCVCRSPRDAYIASTLVYLVILPFMSFLGFALAFYTGTSSFIEGLMTLGGYYWQLLVMLFIIFSGWTTNNGNLYSAAIALTPSIKIPFKGITLILGILGVIFASLNLLENFEETLSAMGIVIAALGAALIARLISDNFSYKPLSIYTQRFYQISILLGLGIGIFSLLGWINLTSFAFIDSFLATFFVTLSYEGSSYVFSNRFR